MKEVKKLNYTKLDGISEKQLSEHHDVLYKGYVDKINYIDDMLAKVDREKPNATLSQLRSFKLGETFALNGVKLHEGYFDNMKEGGEECSGKIKELIERDFGSLNAWEEDFKAIGMAARGWVVLTYDLDEKKLRNILCDSHNQGGVWNAVSLLIMDVYEHAYFIDFATARKTYIDTFFKNLNWSHVNELITKYGIEN